MLQPCKHCGYPRPFMANKNGRWCVLCLGLDRSAADICGARTQWRRTEEMAREEWNGQMVMQEGNSRGSIAA